MPPKKQKVSAKTEKKAKEKIVEDKTFGLKNKNKSKQVQKYIKEVSSQVMHGHQKGGQRAREEAEHKKKAEKKKTAAQKALMASLFKGMPQLANNPQQEAKTQNIDMYVDPREKIGKKPDTIITCKYFLEAVEKQLYGFNWVCPNKGDDCEYLHMLPPGYVLNLEKKKKKKPGEPESDEEEKLTLEEQIEEERTALPSEGLIPVTLETFTEWKRKRAEAKQKEIEDKIKAEEAKGKKDVGRMNFMSGKSLFTFNPELFKDDEGAADDAAYEEEGVQPQAKDNEEKKEAEVDAALFAEGDGADEDVDFD